jgi:hypothetical protein
MHHFFPEHLFNPTLTKEHHEAAGYRI